MTTKITPDTKKLVTKDSDNVKITALNDDARFLAVAEMVLNRHLSDFQKLADEGDANDQV